MAKISENFAYYVKYARKISLFRENAQAFLGRNGWAECHGVLLLEAGTQNGERIVSLVPITSRGNQGRCEIRLPAAALRQLCVYLEEWDAAMIKEARAICGMVEP